VQLLNVAPSPRLEYVNGELPLLYGRRGEAHAQAADLAVEAISA
jgi:hypothetical protein